MGNNPIRLFRMNVDRLNDITIGREAENNAAAVEINISRWLSIWPDGIPAIWLLRPGENTRYPAVIERVGDVIRWLVRDYDMAIPGVARMEVTLQDGENIAISAAAFATIAHRIGKTEGEAGETEPDWSKNVIEKTAENAERAEDAAKRAEEAGGGVDFTTDETLTLENGILSVNRATAAEPDNTLPITSAAVYAEIGNINALLETI